MDQNEKTRLRERGSTTVSRERPRTPADRPKAARPRTGNAVQREAARRARAHAAPEEGERVRSPRPRPEGASGPRSAPGQTRKKRNPPEPEEAQRRRAGRARKKKPHRVYNTNFGFKFAVMLAVVAVIVLSMVIFFKVKHINVLLPTDESGEIVSYYTEQDIKEAAGINIDDNLLSLSKDAVAARIYAALPYVNELQIKKQLPGTVIISFSEFDVTYAIQDEKGGWWLMSREGRILEAADEQSIRGHLSVTGMPIQVPEPGDYIKPAATDGADMSEIANKQTVVLAVIPALEQAPFVKELTSVDVSTSYDLTLWYGTRYKIRLGTIENLSYKLQFLQSTLENKDVQARSGVIDLTFNEDNKVHFLEFQ